jgi:hypothetical protein
MIIDPCENYKESAKRTILSFMEHHGFKDDTISPHEIKGKKSDVGVEQTLSIHFNFCSTKPTENIVKATAWVGIESDFTNEPSDHMIKHEGQFTREETILPDKQLETIEKCMEYVFKQQQQYTNYLRTEE